MLQDFFLAFVLVYPCQFNRVHCCPSVFPYKACALPKPSVSHVGNFFTVKRYFETKEEAKKFAAYMKQKFSKGTLENPILTGGQQSLF
jgi:hypothetical protein